MPISTSVEFFDGLVDLGLLDSSLVVFTSDHGEELSRPGARSSRTEPAGGERGGDGSAVSKETCAACSHAVEPPAASAAVLDQDEIERLRALGYLD